MSADPAAARADTVHRELLAAVERVATRHGMSVTRLSQARIGGGVEVTFEIREPNGPTVTEGDRARFLRKAAEHGLSPTDLGRGFRTAGVEFQVVGWHKSSVGAPVFAEACMSGILHRFPVSQVAAAIEAASARTTSTPPTDDSEVA